MNGRRHLLYTTEEGGYFKFGDPDRYANAVLTGKLDVTPADQDPDNPNRDYVEPVYIAIVETVENHDFLLGRSRPEQTPVA